MPYKATILFIILALCIMMPLALYAQQPNPYYQLKGSNYVLAKNYYLLNLIQNNPAVKKLLEADPELVKLSHTKIDALKASLSCKEISCFTEKLKFSADEITLVGNKLATLYTPTNALGQLVSTDLIPSGAYVLNAKLPAKEQLVKAWEQDAGGVNYAISIYAEGAKPLYAEIDSISFNIKSKSYPAVLGDEAAVTLEKYKDTRLFFNLVLGYALQALEINGRNDAANFEPLAAGINKGLIAKVKSISWANYNYSAVLVLGAGPGDLNTPISAVGMLRCQMGATRYFAGLAPFIIVSGGMAHPYKTKYCEAVEMKKYLVNSLHVPADAIIAETQARHTTTNVRNSVRLIYRYRLPPAKAFLTVSSKSHVESVKTLMGIRCLKELKYIPYAVGKRYDDNALELYPSIQAMQINPMEPLDPK